MQGLSSENTVCIIISVNSFGGAMSSCGGMLGVHDAVSHMKSLEHKYWLPFGYDEASAFSIIYHASGVQDKTVKCQTREPQAPVGRKLVMSL